MSRRHIRLELAREPGSPNGDDAVGYDLVLPLDAAQRLDATAAEAEPDQTRVRRFIRNETLAVGRLVRDAERGWMFDFPGEADDATGFRLEDEAFTPGEYVSVADADGVMHPYRVTLSRPVDKD